MPPATIIITTHNRPDQLPRAIASALAAARDVEIVVVDDASSDATASLCRRTPAIKYVRVLRTPGGAGARNVGLVASRGEFISFLDDDDVRLPNSLDHQIELLSQSPPAAFCYAPAIAADEGGRQSLPFPADCPQGDIFWELLTRNFIPCGSVVFRRSCLSRVGLLNDRLSRIDDWDLWVRMAEIFPVASSTSPAIIWRQATPTSSQGSSQTIELISMGARQFREGWSRLPRFANAGRRRRQAAWRAFSGNVAEHLTWETVRGIVELQPRLTVSSARVLLRLHPSAIYQVARRWLRVSTLLTLTKDRLTHDDLTNAKDHFKQLRSAAS
jgi:hypothetical protein